MKSTWTHLFSMVQVPTALSKWPFVTSRTYRQSFWLPLCAVPGVGLKPSDLINEFLSVFLLYRSSIVNTCTPHGAKHDQLQDNETSIPLPQSAVCTLKYSPNSSCCFSTPLSTSSIVDFIFDTKQLGATFSQSFLGINMNGLILLDKSPQNQNTTKE